jgi:dienelactone hydrolase
MTVRTVIAAFLLAFTCSPAGAAALTADPWPAPSPGAEGIAVTLRSHSPFVLEDIGAGAKLDPPRRVDALLYMPDEASAARPAPAVVLLHGTAGVQDGRELTYARQFAAMGVAALVVDTFGARRDVATEYVERLLRITETMMVADAYAALDFLAARPDLDARHVALMGFAYGGMATVLAAYEQVAARFAPAGRRFAAHISLYGPCLARFEDHRATGAPILMLGGQLDTVSDPKRCAETADELRRGGAAVETIRYPGAYAQWDGEQGGPGNPVRRAHNMSGCRFSVDRNGVVRDDRSGIEMSNGFYRKLILALCDDPDGYLLQRDPAIRALSNRDIGRFLAAAFGAGAAAGR